MQIEEVSPETFDAWVTLRFALWPDSTRAALTAEAEAILEAPDQVGFIALDNARHAIGFIEGALHAGLQGLYGHVEGWYVVSERQKQGCGHALMNALEQWCLHRSIGLLTSDTEAGYPSSPPAHLGCGFRVLHELTVFAKDLQAPKALTGDTTARVEVRPIQARDRRGIVAVADALPEWFDADARGRAIPVDLRHQQGFVAVLRDEILGFITLFVAEGRLNIGWLGVRPDKQHDGIGSRLLARAEDFARANGLDEIATWTLGDGVDYPPYDATRRFYYVRGFTVYQRSTTDNPSCPEEIKIKKRVAELDTEDYRDAGKPPTSP